MIIVISGQSKNPSIPSCRTDSIKIEPIDRFRLYHHTSLK